MVIGVANFEVQQLGETQNIPVSSWVYPQAKEQGFHDFSNGKEILDFFKNHIAKSNNLELKMLHFFVDSGIKDNFYYWGEFQKGLKMFVELKKLCPELRALNLGGGFPIKNTLGFEYDYKYIVNEIVRNIKETCEEEGIQEPDIFTEFGKYTVGESGAVIFEVLEHKKQSDAEHWYIINNSLMNTIPDSWSILEKFI